MKRVDDLRLSSEYLRLALPLMSKHQIPVTPENYAVWYEYVSGTNQELNEELDQLSSGGAAINAEVIGALHEKYVANWDELRHEQAREELYALIDQVGGSVSAAGGEVTRYQDALAGYAEQLSGEINQDTLRHLVADMSKDTESVRASGDQLCVQLEESRREAEQLRKDLEVARREATIDALTGLANRKAFDEALHELTTRAGAAGAEYCLIMADIDRFKHINDTYGHLLGDKVIKFVAKTLRDSVKGKDLAARFGGEEFAVLLPDTALDGALALAENIRAAIETGRLVRSDTREPMEAFSISIGVARFRGGDSPTMLVARADEALYRAKEGGRNRVVAERNLDATGTHG